MPQKKGEVMNGLQLKVAAYVGIPIWYEHRFYNPQDKHKDFVGVTTMEAATIGFFIGNTDIEIDNFEDRDAVLYRTDEEEVTVYCIEGINYTRLKDGEGNTFGVRSFMPGRGLILGSFELLGAGGSKGVDIRDIKFFKPAKNKS